MQAQSISRRSFLKKAGVACACGLWDDVRGSAATLPTPNRIGYSTIAWPESQFERALETISKLGFAGVQLVGWARERYANRVEALRARLQSLHLTPVAQSCWGVKLDPESLGDNAATVRAYAEFFQGLGGSILQVTDGGKPDGQYSAENIRQLGERMNDLGCIAQDHGLELGYHPHVGSFGETEAGVASILGATDPHFVRLIADTGHLALGGMDPAKIIRKYRDRLILVHLKDVRKDAYAAARASRAALRDRKYLFCEIGSGALDLASVRTVLREIDYLNWIIVELDGNKPARGGPDKGARANRHGLKKLGWEMKSMKDEV
jgi:inosose dehydratase